MTDLQIRRIPFSFDETVPFQWHPTNPEFGVQMNIIGVIAIAFEKYIVAAMSASRGNVTQASKALGVHRNTLHNKLRTQTMLNGFAESIRPARRRISAKRVTAPRSKDGRSGRSTR